MSINDRASAVEEPPRRALFFGGEDAIADAYRRSCPAGWSVDFFDSLDAEALNEALESADAFIHRDRSIRSEHLAAAARVRVIQRHGVGLDTLDVDLISAHHIPVCANPEGTEAVAEHAVMLILSAMRGLCEMNLDVKTGHWRRDRFSPRSRSLVGATVGIAGYGRIGRAVARRLRTFGCRIRVYSRSVRPGGSTGGDGAPVVTFVGSVEELFSTSDIVSLHLPLTTDTFGVVDSRLLKHFRPGSVLVNTARGGLLRTGDVVRALDDGTLSAVAVDVMADTGNLAKDPLIAHPRVIATPHAAAATRDTFDRKVRFTFANLDRAVDGQPLLERVL
ncbi:MAG: D-isomer specific 2-hydroxyacid dehydrogenase family protein [Chloroflexota bacterium]